MFKKISNLIISLKFYNSQNPLNDQMAQKDNPAANALMEQIFNGNKQDQPEQAIQMPELALRCAQFFHSLSQYCLYFYKNYNREADIHKTKLIKKVDKQKKNKHDGSKKTQNEDRKARAQRGQNEPQPPKKPLTAYILYFQDKKPSFSQKFPSLSLSELTKLIAKDWKDLKQDQKKPYLDRAADDRKRYESEMNEFKRKYRLGEGSKQEPEQVASQNKGSEAGQQKEQQIPMEIEEQIKAVEQFNEAEIGEKSEREEENLEDGNDQDDDQQGEEDDSQINEGQQGDDDIQNQGSDEGRIQEEQ